MSRFLAKKKKKKKKEKKKLHLRVTGELNLLWFFILLFTLIWAYKIVKN